MKQESTASKSRAPYELRKGTIGVAGIVFLVITAASPLAASLSTSPIIFGAIGRQAAGAYVAAGIVLLLFAVGYAAMSRYVTSAAGFAAYIEQGLGRIPAFSASAVAVVSYNAMLVGVYAGFGYFTHAIVIQETGFDIPWQLATAVAVAVVAVMGYIKIDLSAKVIGVLLIAEMALLTLFIVATPAKGGASGLSVAGLVPPNIFGGETGIALLFAASCFIGFEATAIYGEEARNPRRTVPRATFIAIILISGFYALMTWAIGLAYTPTDLQDMAVNDPANLVLSANTQFVGAWSTDILNVLLISSYLASLIALHNTTSRYMFSLGRGGVLPAPLRRTHPKWQSPHIASVVTTTISVVVLALFIAAGSDPFSEIFAPAIALGTLGILALQACTGISVVAYFARRRGQETLWTGLIAPSLGAAGIVLVLFYAITNWDLFTGATSGVVAQLPWVLLATALLGIGLAWIKRHTVGSITTGFLEEPSKELTTPEVP